MNYGYLCSPICRHSCSRCTYCVASVHILRLLTSNWIHDLSCVWSGNLNVWLLVWNISTSSDQPTIQTSNTRGMGSKLITQETRTCYQNANKKQTSYQLDCASYSNLHKTQCLTQGSVSNIHINSYSYFHKPSNRVINNS